MKYLILFTQMAGPKQKKMPSSPESLDRKVGWPARLPEPLKEKPKPIEYFFQTGFVMFFLSMNRFEWMQRAACCLMRLWAGKGDRNVQ